jgi:chemotaxis protein histidine kinase CheA
MTISSTTVRNSYSGDNSTTTFSYTFKIFADSDIQVIIRSANGTETTKTITTHYTVTGAGNSGGGSVIFTSGNIPTSTQTVVLRRNIPQTQAIDYIANDPFPAESHEEGLDRATMAIQQLQEELTRSIKLSKTNTMTSTEFSVGASDRANKILAFDTNGELAVTQELGTNRGNWSSGVTFNGRDIVKDSSNNNIYLCNTTHTSSGTTPISSNADVAKWDLIVDAAAASTSANAAANSAANSSNFANTSANHASNSANHASNSSNFANNSSNSANTASTYLAGVSANANAAANSAANSSNFANNSSNSANSSANHSSNSSNFANNSSNSANTSANHASNSSNFANNSSNSANASSNHSANSSNFANNSSNHAANSSNFANASSNHASNSSNHSANSSNFANTSSNHAANSSNFSNNSSNFANTASNSANAANSARDAALAAADNFDDVYLGSKTADPTLDNDGDALTAGDLYYNSVGTVLKYYTGSAWVSITSGGITDLVQDTTPQLGGMLDVNGQSIGDGTLELVKFAETASAVNEITVTNSATGTAPQISATGDDTNIDLRLATKGTGGVVFNAGAVGTPALTTSGDLNTGIFFPAADTIAFTEGGTEAMRINSSGTLGIGTTSPQGKLTVSNGTDNNFEIFMTNPGGGSDTTLQAFNRSGSVYKDLYYTSLNHYFLAGGTERMRITSGNTVLIGKTVNDTATAGIAIETNGKFQVTRAESTLVFVNRTVNDGALVSFRQDDIEEGTISVSGTTVSYNGFTGSHWSRFIGDSKPDVLRGTVMESLDQMVDWYAVEWEVSTTENDETKTHTKHKPYSLKANEQEGDVITYNFEGTDYQATIVKEVDVKHVMSKISDTSEAKNVYGVFSAWDNDDLINNDFYVASCGSYVVRIKAGQTVSKGDLLQSNGDGTAKVQADDLVRASSFAKVLSNTVIDTYEDGSFIVPCSLMC